MNRANAPTQKKRGPRIGSSRLLCRDRYPNPNYAAFCSGNFVMVYPRSKQSNNEVASRYDGTHSGTNQTKVAPNGRLRYFHDCSFHRVANYRSAHRIATARGLIPMLWVVLQWIEKILRSTTMPTLSTRDDLASDTLAGVQQQPGLTM